MTIPTGHQDYQAYAQWRGPVFAAVTPGITIASPYHTEEYVTNFASVYLSAKLTSGTGFTVVMTFYTDATKTVVLRTMTWILCFSTTRLSVIVPALGNYVALDITTAQAGTQQATIALVPLNIAPAHDTYVETDAEAEGTAVSIPGSGTLTVNIPGLVKGTGYCLVSPANNTDLNSLTVFSLSESGGSLGRLGRVNAMAGVQQFFFQAPTEVVQLVISNANAAAQNFNYHIQVLGQ